LAGKHDRTASVVDRLDLLMSSGQDIDGLWVGAELNEQSALPRIQDALRLIKQQSPLHYSRVVQHLKRVWVHLVPHGNGCYYRSLDACMLDPRYVRSEATKLEEIASTIVHEATHARLERWGISYDEDKRIRIEAICRRRELEFLARLPDSETLREQIARTQEWYAGERNYFSDASFQQRILEGRIEHLRYLKVPARVIRFIVKTAAMRVVVLRWAQRVVGPLRQT
jgi:hypothetical protein